MASFRPKGFVAETVSHFRVALCKAMLSCSDKFADGERQRLLKSTDISSLGKEDKKVKLIMEADSFLQDCRALVASVNAPEAVRRSLIGIADVRTVHFVLNKPDPSRGACFPVSTASATS